MSEKTSKVTEPRINPADDVITRDKLEPFFENIKELIVSTAKGTETVLGKRIDKVENELQLTQQALKATKDELRTEIKATKDELRSEIKDTETRLRTEIKETEVRLSGKIDGVHVRQDNHEDRITALEEAR